MSQNDGQKYEDNVRKAIIDINGINGKHLDTLDDLRTEFDTQLNAELTHNEVSTLEVMDLFWW